MNGRSNAAEILDQLESFFNRDEPASGLAGLLWPIALSVPLLSRMAGEGPFPSLDGSLSVAAAKAEPARV